jgi:hypothetical protein
VGSYNYDLAQWEDFKFQGANVEIEAVSGGYVKVIDGGIFRIENAGSVDFADFQHDGTDFNTTFTGTANWNIDGMGVGGSVLVNAKVELKGDGTVRWGTAADAGVLTWDTGKAILNTLAGYDLVLDSATGIVMVQDGNTFRIANSLETDYGDFAHDGTDFTTAFTNTTDWDISGLTGDVWIRDGAGLKISDSGDTDFMDMSHDGANFNFAVTTTNTVDFTGATWYQFSADVKARSGLQVAGGVGTTGTDEVIAFVDVNGGKARFGGYNWGLAAWQPMLLSGSTIQVSAVTTTLDLDAVTSISIDAGTDISLETGTNGIVTLGEHTTAKFQVNTNTNTIDIRDGYLLRVKDSADTDYGEFSHDGTDFQTVFSNTADWNIDLAQNLTGQIKVFTDTHFVSGTEVRIRDTANTDWCAMAHDGTDFNFTHTNSVEENHIGASRGYVFDKSIYMAEIAAAAVDKTGHGQLWIKNTTPCQLWFTDDAGTDTQIV